jgi:hypothetical protein
VSSLIDIYRQALAKVGTRTTIASPDEDTPEGRQLRLFYPTVRQQAMRAANWGFCRWVANGTLLRAAPGTPENTASWDGIWTTSMPPAPWLYSYVLPADCLRMRQVAPQSASNDALAIPLFPDDVYAAPAARLPSARFEVGMDRDNNGKPTPAVLTNQSQALFVYTLDITNPQLFPSDFVETVSSALAGQICMQLGGDLNRTKILLQAANMAIEAARMADANQGHERREYMPDSIAARGTNFNEGRHGVWFAPYGPAFAVPA